MGVRIRSSKRHIDGPFSCQVFELIDSEFILADSLVEQCMRILVHFHLLRSLSHLFFDFFELNVSRGTSW